MKLRGVRRDILAIAIALEMAFFTPNLSSKNLLGIALILSSVVLGSSPSLAQPELPAPPASKEELEDSETVFIRPQVSCPADFDTVATLLVRDIPSYTNRILQSSVADIPSAYRPAYVITANQPELSPLDITDRVYTTSASSGEPLRQLFFTTLERQYTGLKASAINHFHWLFLSPDEDGWQMVFMFSAIEAENEVQLPPRDSSQGSVGQAVRRWLTDCHAQAIDPE